MNYHSFTITWFIDDSRPSYGRAGPPQTRRRVRTSSFRAVAARTHKGDRMLRRWCIPLAGLALVGGALATSAPAAASPRAHPTGPTIHMIRPAMHGIGPMTAVGRSRHAVQSTNWSGYAAHTA